MRRFISQVFSQRSLQFSLQRWHPQNWNYKIYLATAGALLAINLFGPKGLVHWVLIGQESARLESERLRLQGDIDEVQLEMQRFRRSDVAKARAIREQLGFVQPGEVSLEIIDDRARTAPSAPSASPVSPKNGGGAAR